MADKKVNGIFISNVEVSQAARAAVNAGSVARPGKGEK
jgi:hypothetical protein